MSEEQKTGNSRSLNIVVIDSFEDVGGGQMQLVDFSIAAQKYGYAEITAITSKSNHKLIKILKENSTSVICCDFNLRRSSNRTRRSVANLHAFLRHARELKNILKSQKFDIVQSYNFYSSMLLSFIKLTGGIPGSARLIFLNLSERAQTPAGLYDYIRFIAADGVAFNSSFTKNSYISVLNAINVPASICYSIVRSPTGVLTLAERTALQKEIGISEGQKVIGFFGAISPWKKVHEFIDAVSVANGAGASKATYFALIVGGYTGPSESDYERRVRELASEKLPGAHAIVPYTSNVFSLMRLCDVVCLLSTNEPFGRVLVEAVHLNIPFVAIDSAGPKEIISFCHPQAGALVPPGDIGAIASAIIDKAMQGGGGGFVSDIFSVDAILERHFRFLYQDCGARPVSSGRWLD